jgi:hypothetical protein
MSYSLQHKFVDVAKGKKIFRVAVSDSPRRNSRLSKGKIPHRSSAVDDSLKMSGFWNNQTFRIRTWAVGELDDVPTRAGGRILPPSSAASAGVAARWSSPPSLDQSVAFDFRSLTSSARPASAG